MLMDVFESDSMSTLWKPLAQSRAIPNDSATSRGISTLKNRLVSVASDTIPFGRDPSNHTIGLRIHYWFLILISSSDNVRDDLPTHHPEAYSPILSKIRAHISLEFHQSYHISGTWHLLSCVYAFCETVTIGKNFAMSQEPHERTNAFRDWGTPNSLPHRVSVHHIMTTKDLISGSNSEPSVRLMIPHYTVTTRMMWGYEGFNSFTHHIRHIWNNHTPIPSATGHYKITHLSSLVYHRRVGMHMVNQLTKPTNPFIMPEPNLRTITKIPRGMSLNKVPRARDAFP
ncbi:putative ribonuclease H protein [Senna tora]|uniref:Putative ribonuclease H protein n=1 Tax=Senna tora TaxID=362788 RepID=A0A834WN95_9FABA|nr:putative ribonuclease H protein [Senna tora]